MFDNFIRCWSLIQYGICWKVCGKFRGVPRINPKSRDPFNSEQFCFYGCTQLIRIFTLGTLAHYAAFSHTQQITFKIHRTKLEENAWSADQKLQTLEINQSIMLSDRTRLLSFKCKSLEQPLLCLALLAEIPGRKLIKEICRTLCLHRRT